MGKMKMCTEKPRYEETIVESRNSLKTLRLGGNDKLQTTIQVSGRIV